tara:strand:+ start:82 stop:1593 length:1512 start_codon:yes stop_codon:yes gene_type:complete
MQLTGKDTTYSAVYDTFDNVDIKDELKFFCFPMRTGKTYLTINDFVPYLFSNTNLNWIVLTAPLNGIINQNKKDLKISALGNGFVYENDLYEVSELLKDGVKVVSYFSNAAAFTQASTSEFLDSIDVSRVGMFIDEADYGSTDCADNLRKNKAYDCPTYKGSMYKFTCKVAAYSTHIYALTATPSFQAKNLFPTFGSLAYKIYKDMKPGEQTEFAARVAWASEAHFFTCKDNALFTEVDQTKNTILKMLRAMVDTEKATGVKRSCIIQTENIIKLNPTGTYNENVVREILTSSKAQEIMREVVNDKDDFAAVMNAENMYRFNLLNKKIKKPRGEKKRVTEAKIFKDIDDEKKPIRVLLVKMMAGRGVTLKTVKELMTLKRSDQGTPFGYPTESREQFIGRGKTPYAGQVEVKDLFKKYDMDVRNIPSELFSNEMVNSYRYWAADMPSNRKAWDNHLKYDACTFDMLDFNLAELCPCCGQSLPNNVVEISFDTEALDKALDIAA